MKKPIVFVTAFLLSIFLSMATVNAAEKPYGAACTPGTDTCRANPNTGAPASCNPGPGGYFCYNTAAYNQLLASKFTPKNALETYCATEGGCVDVQVTGMINQFRGFGNGGSPGAVRTGLGYIALLIKQQPASGVEYIAYARQKLSPPAANAQGQTFGFGSLNPILELWSLTRNIALGGFVVIFVAIGIMVILRKKIDPRTVITIQQAIPKIVVSLLLVIFSYAIVGLLIDTITVATRIGVTVLQNAKYIAYSTDASERAALVDRLVNTNIFKLYDQLFNVDELVAGFANLDDGLNAVASVLSIDAGGGGGITRLVLWIAMFIAVLRTFFMLLTSYLTVTITVIIAPFQFLFYAIPGQSGDFGSWLRNLLSHLLVFPTVFFMLCFAAMFYSQENNIVWYTNETYAPRLGNINELDNVWRTGREVIGPQQPYWTPPGLGNWGGVVGPLITLAILLTIPRTINVVRESLQVKPGASEGAVQEGIQSATRRIPFLGSFTKA